MYLNKDKLTGLYQEEYFKFRLEEEALRNFRYKRSMTLILIEVAFTHFVKNYDLRWGFAYTILRQLGKFIRDSIRRIDIAGRLSGDQFAIILPETPEEGAMILAERIRKLVENHIFKGNNEVPDIKVAVNVGVAVFPKHGKNSDELLTTAQRSLVLARDEGGNLVKLYPEIIYREELAPRRSDSPGPPPPEPGPEAPWPSEGDDEGHAETSSPATGAEEVRREPVEEPADAAVTAAKEEQAAPHEAPAESIQAAEGAAKEEELTETIDNRQ
jgi:diguanylate cyclase (GGDEF)-like protein